MGRLTAARMSSCRATHGRDARQTSSMTQSEIAVIRSVRSASGMNADGASRPSSGWFQRISASTPTMRMSSRRRIG